MQEGKDMKGWFDRLRFFWEESSPPRVARPAVDLGAGPGRGGRPEPAGVSRPLRAAARFTLIGTVATTLMAQVIGVRLIAPVDAATNYRAQCNKACNQAHQNCQQSCPNGNAGKACRDACQQQHKDCLENCKDA
jgi:hypothetical protein